MMHRREEKLSNSPKLPKSKHDLLALEVTRNTSGHKTQSSQNARQKKILPSDKKSNQSRNPVPKSRKLGTAASPSRQNVSIVLDRKGLQEIRQTPQTKWVAVRCPTCPLCGSEYQTDATPLMEKLQNLRYQVQEEKLQSETLKQFYNEYLEKKFKEMELFIQESFMKMVKLIEKRSENNSQISNKSLSPKNIQIDLRTTSDNQKQNTYQDLYKRHQVLNIENSRLLAENDRLRAQINEPHVGSEGLLAISLSERNLKYKEKHRFVSPGRGPTDVESCIKDLQEKFKTFRNQITQQKLKI